MTDVSVTADTNILALGLGRLHTHPDAAPVQFVQAWLTDQFLLVQSERRAADYDEDVVSRTEAERTVRRARTLVTAIATTLAGGNTG